MKYIKVLFFTFLAIFFADQILPEIKVTQTKLPHFGADIPFAFGLALLNSLIYPIVRGFKGNAPILQTAVIATILNFAAYGAMNLLHRGVQVETISGYFMVTIVVTVASFLANYFSMRADLASPAEPPLPPPDIL